jgi:hypothetical protein
MAGISSGQQNKLNTVTAAFVYHPLPEDNKEHTTAKKQTK